MLASYPLVYHMATNKKDKKNSFKYLPIPIYIGNIISDIMIPKYGVNPIISPIQGPTLPI